MTAIILLAQFLKFESARFISWLTT